jgi:hypothetical protein
MVEVDTENKTLSEVPDGFLHIFWDKTDSLRAQALTLLVPFHQALLPQRLHRHRIRLRLHLHRSLLSHPYVLFYFLQQITTKVPVTQSRTRVSHLFPNRREML